MRGFALFLFQWLLFIRPLATTVMAPPPTPLSTTTTMAPPSSPCEQWQFSCPNGLCIAPNRFCDGNDDCGDSFDEPDSCTNCNQTLMGEDGIKYPLRITEPPPLNRHLPFSCMLNFVARPGKRVEITFLSFQIGSLQTPNPKDSPEITSSVCRNGYLRLSETGDSGSQEDRFRSQQTRGFSQLISALKEPDSRKRLSALFDDASGSTQISEPTFGHFCGRLLQSLAGVSFFSSRSNVTVAVHLPPRTAVGSPQPFVLYLTYRFLPYATVSPTSPTNDNDLNMPLHFGKPVPKTYCDRTFVDCDRKLCLIRSPNFPGLFLRNFSCTFYIRQERIPSGKAARIEVSQTNEYKIRVGATSLEAAGRSVGDHDTSGRSAGLTSDCDYDDVVEIFDGKSNPDSQSNKRFPIAKFCGSGVLTPVTSSGPDMEVLLRSRSEGLLYASKLELRLRVRYYNTTGSEKELRVNHFKQCELTVNGSETPFGIISSPRHTLAQNTMCYVNFIGSRATQRVWIYFLSYFVRGGNSLLDQIPNSEISPADNCDVSALELYFNVSSNYTEAPNYRFCERTTPAMCTRAADYMDSIPEKPCLPPEQSYLSSTHEASLKYSFFGSKEVASSTDASLFVLRFEFVDFEPTKPQVAFSADNESYEQHCGKVFRNGFGNGHLRGKLSSPINVFQYGRGGTDNLICRYKFHVRPDQKLSISINEFRTTLRNCKTIFDPLLRSWKCHFDGRESYRKALITVSESTHTSQNMLVDCLCSNVTSDGKTSALVFESTKFYEGLPPRESINMVEITFTVTGMTAVEDHRHFGFEANFVFSETSHSDSAYGCYIKTVRGSNSSGEITFFTRGNRCRWSMTSRSLTPPRLRLRGTPCDRRNPPRKANGRLLVYGPKRSNTSLGSFWEPLIAICDAESSRNTQLTSLEDLSSFLSTKTTVPPSMSPSATALSSAQNASNDHKIPSQNADAVVMEIISAGDYETTVEWRVVNGDSSAVVTHEVSHHLGVEAQEISNPAHVNCAFRCPELNACINPELLCDGVSHCPITAYDEAPENCSIRPVAFYVAVATGVSLLVGMVVASVAFLIVRRNTVFPWRRRNVAGFQRNTNSEDKTRSLKKQRLPKCYSRQIQAVEVRYPIIHM